MLKTTISALVEVIGEVRHRELVELRARFNLPSQGGWGIVFDPNASRWTAVRGKQVAVYAGTAAELRDRIMSRLWATFN
jgi:hypothetical protein